MKYKVPVILESNAYVEVEAKSKEEAIEKAIFGYYKWVEATNEEAIVKMDSPSLDKVIEVGED